MEDNSAQTPTKKSGFSFRKKRSNSKTRKNDEQKPVDIEKNDEINDAEIAKSGECSAAESGDSPPRKNIDSEAEGGLTANEEEGAGVEEDPSPKGVKSEESAKEPTKKKTKRRSRGLFRRSSKNKDVAKNAEACEEEAKVEREAHEKVEQEASEAKASEVGTSDGNEQVACDESGERSEVGEQSDGEYAGNASGAASECEDDDGHGKDSVAGNETAEEAAANDKKKGEQKNATKKKKFFKRGLSLRRSKSKKNQENQEGSEAKEKKSEQNAPKETNEIGVSTDSRLDLSQFAAQGDQTSSIGEPPVEVIQEDNEAKACEDSGKERKEDIENEEDTKKAPAKPVRKVSFADPERATAAESSDDGDSPSDEVTIQEKEDSPQVPPPSAVETVVETDPIELPPIVASEAEAETEEPEEPKKTDVDEDDELTEVSSVTSSLVASSDAHSQADPQESLPSVFEDAEETGSRITLLDSVELGEGSKAAEGDGKEAPKDACEDCERDKLLGEKQQEKKDGEWIMLDQSCDVTGELQRMRKQTLFSVKRLCCSVM